MKIQLYKKFFLLALFLVLPTFASAEVLFETDFENVQDWMQTRPTKIQTGYDWPHTWSDYNNGNPTYPGPKKNDGTFLFDAFRVSPTLFDPPNVTNIFEIKNGIGRSGSKGLNYNIEVSGKYGIWSGGNPIELWLGAAGAQDIYVRFYLKYPPVWSFTQDNEGLQSIAAMQKLVRIARYNGNFGDANNPHIYNESYNFPDGYNYPVWIPDWVQNITPTSAIPWKPSYTRLSNSERYAPDYAKNDASDDYFANKPSLFPTGMELTWPSDSEWHSYEFRAKMNSAPGVSDGISEIWLDGVKMWRKTGIPWVGASLELLPVSIDATNVILRDDTVTDSEGNTAKVLQAYHTGTDGKNYISVSWNDPAHKIGANTNITATHGGIATVNSVPILFGGDIDNGWNHINILDNATLASYPLSSQVTFPLYVDDISVSTSYIGSEPQDFVAPKAPSELIVQ